MVSLFLILFGVFNYNILERFFFYFLFLFCWERGGGVIFLVELKERIIFSYSFYCFLGEDIFFLLTSLCLSNSVYLSPSSCFFVDIFTSYVTEFLCFMNIKFDMYVITGSVLVLNGQTLRRSAFLVP